MDSRLIFLHQLITVIIKVVTQEAKSGGLMDCPPHP
jgi:hypothetical protein